MSYKMEDDLVGIAISIATGVFGEFEQYDRKELISEANLRYLFKVDLNSDPNKFFFRMSRCPILSTTKSYRSCNELVLIIIFIVYQSKKDINREKSVEYQLKLIANAISMFDTDQNIFIHLRDCNNKHELKAKLDVCYNNIIEWN